LKPAVCRQDGTVVPLCGVRMRATWLCETFYRVKLKMKRHGHLIVRIINAVILMVAVGVIYALYQFNQPPVNMAKLEQLRAGMSKNAVRQILGEPTVVRGKHEWSYERMLSWPILYIYFDKKETYKEYVYDP
jgi:hypothetical protein